MAASLPDKPEPPGAALSLAAPDSSCPANARSGAGQPHRLEREEALVEYQLALKTYHTMATRFPGNETAEKAIRDLTGQGIQ